MRGSAGGVAGENRHPDLTYHVYACKKGEINLVAKPEPYAPAVGLSADPHRSPRFENKVVERSVRDNAVQQHDAGFEHGNVWREQQRQQRHLTCPRKQQK